VLTEGYNNPGVEVIYMARPTKSRALYTQMVGRSTRPLPGIVDGLAGPAERKAAIASSPKPFTRIIDFVGNSGRHKLISAFDVLGGHVSDEVVEKAVKKAQMDGIPVKVVSNLNNTEAAIKVEKQKAEQKRAMAKVDYNLKDVNVFGGDGLGAAWHNSHHGPSASPKQIKVMRRAGVHPDYWGKRMARFIIGKLVENNWQIPEQFRFWRQPKASQST
jgi:type I site-specific restriction endonuclease